MSDIEEFSELDVMNVLTSNEVLDDIQIYDSTVKDIPDTVSDVLSLGDNFALPIEQKQKNDRNNLVLDVVKNFEVHSNILPTDTIETTRISISNILQRFLDKNKRTSYSDRCILHSYAVSKRYLRENKDITRADKDQITVVMDKSDYFDKMELLLSDTTTYRELNKDPLKRLTNKINELVKSWRRSGLIGELTYKNLNCTNGNLPRCYGLPKIHKDGFPLRIIVSALGSPVYNISSYIHDILYKSIRKPSSYIKDGWSFVEIIKNTDIDKDNIMVSLDVASLFTNVPKDLVVKAIRKRWEDIAKNTKFNLSQFLFATELILDSTCFAFNGRFYEQIFGTPMGSPLSPILADMVMENLEMQCLNSLGFTVSTYYRFVDDVFAIVPRAKINEILTKFNNYHELKIHL
ncbi:uncharacterized protein LOC112639708 [Camponotus floridanus]|uniref:uncharacterized protein LOC112639708 n=1 Tax=Camponotus floridanus TaxID=104421 RepID=UPI000DC690E8|nr:uncharacterized protein LOC112639708 [Camponotus floridanus]